jgi:proteasome lid subunit RPN8/RPN11
VARRGGVAVIAVALLREVARHARECFPQECCGYLTSDAIVRCTNAQASGNHPITPERGPETGFVIAGAELFVFARSFDGPSPARVVYHSHTNGRAYLSAVDRDVVRLAGYPVQQLVVGVTQDAVTEAALFDPQFVEIARWHGEVLG